MRTVDLFVVVLFMVLKDDNINQTMLVPMDLRNLIPEDHPCYFIKNVVDLIDCSNANREFRGKPGEFAYPRELLLRLILMSVFDGGLSSREIERSLYQEYAKRNGLIISTGGGIVKHIESIDMLKENGMVVFIDRKIEKMVINNKRPLAKNKEEVKELLLERYDSYVNNSDFKINNNGSKKRAVIHIVEAFYEYLSN